MSGVWFIICSSSARGRWWEGGWLVNFVVMVNKIDGQTRLLRFVPFVHLPFIFRSFDLFVASLLLMKGISYCLIRRKLERLEYAKANFKRSALFPLLSAWCFVEFDTSIICHVLVYCFGSFLLQDPFLSLQLFAFKGRNMTFTVNVLLTRILYCDPGPGYD